MAFIDLGTAGLLRRTAQVVTHTVSRKDKAKAIKMTTGRKVKILQDEDVIWNGPEHRNLVPQPKTGEVVYIAGGPYAEAMVEAGFCEYASDDDLMQSQLDLLAEEEMVREEEIAQETYWAFYERAGIRKDIALRLWEAGFTDKESIRASFLRSEYDELLAVKGVGPVLARNLLKWADELPEVLIAQELGKLGDADLEFE